LPDVILIIARAGKPSNAMPKLRENAPVARIAPIAA